MQFCKYNYTLDMFIYALVHSSSFNISIKIALKCYKIIIAYYRKPSTKQAYSKYAVRSYNILICNHHNAYNTSSWFKDKIM